MTTLDDVLLTWEAKSMKEQGFPYLDCYVEDRICVDEASYFLVKGYIIEAFYDGRVPVYWPSTGDDKSPDWHTLKTEILT